MWTDDDCKFISDMAYLKDLEEAVFDVGVYHGRDKLRPIYPTGPTVEDRLRDSMSRAAQQAVYASWDAA